MGSINGEGYGLHEMDGEENIDSMRLVGCVYSRALITSTNY